MSATKQVTLSALPLTAEQMKAMPEFSLTDPYAVVAYAVAALCAYPKDKEACYAMLDVLKGPAPLSPMDKQFIRDRFMDGKDYLPFSYFAGATPDNNYTPAQPYTVNLIEQSNSRDQENLITLYAVSGGADSPRPVTLRGKPSTGEWFLWSYEGLLAGIRTPKASDPWA